MGNMYGEMAGKAASGVGKMLGRFALLVIVLIVAVIAIPIGTFFWGRSSATERSWSTHCNPLGEFYLCDDLRGFTYEAVDIQFAAMSLVKTEINEGLEGRESYSFVYGVVLAVSRDTKEPFLVAYYKPNEKDVSVVGSVPIAKVWEEVKAMQGRICPENFAECNWEKMYFVATYEEAVEWADKIVAQVPDKKE